MVNLKAAFEERSNVILKNAIKSRGMTQNRLAEKMGIRESTLCANINRGRISLDVFTKTLDALDFDVIVVDRETGEEIWKVDTER